MVDGVGLFCRQIRVLRPVPSSTPLLKGNSIAFSTACQSSPIILQKAEHSFIPYFCILVPLKFFLCIKNKGRFPLLEFDLFSLLRLAKEKYNDEQRYTFYRTADVWSADFFILVSDKNRLT